ncbi:AAA family ATPase [Saccharothrix sp. NPDC042600]|uniref:AAA family ATPase n=1 Tax=Saccharothrix TaxID=2071 RepID=UPI0033FDF7E0|nr:hypothetical protein GCM10017745_43390 [Saccharothrix mutabilis subsp. capreolus]
MTDPARAIPVLWLCGPPGVGKSTVGWAVYQRLLESGVDAGYVDVDQLGICHPEPASDPGRHLMQARNLDAVVANFAATGARCVVVSGVVDVGRGVPVELVPHAAITVCRLRLDPEEHRRRLAARGAPAGVVERALAEAGVLEPGVAVSVDAGGSVSEVADRVVRHAEALLVEGEVLWLCGATGVGKSTVGFAVYRRLLRAGRTAAYVDLDQIGFHGPLDHLVRARIVATMWRTYRAAGASTLVLTGPLESDPVPYAELLPPITLFRLHASRDRLAARIAARAAGGGWEQPGDPVRGQPPATVRTTVDHAAAQADLLERADLGRRVDTDDLDPDQVADVVLAAFT